MKKKTKKLVLSKETVQGLEKADLREVAGGRPSQQGPQPRPGFCSDAPSCLC